ncbi:MAG: diguanylate cyclase [Desulfobacterales bacterium]|nr:diguanylate cyclase [Desulfobacterales bacterium]
MFNKKLRQSIGFKFLIIVSAILLASTVVISTLIAINERAMLHYSLINKGNGIASYITKLSKDPLVIKDRIELDIIVNQAIKDEEVLYAVIRDASGNLLTSQYASIDYRWPRVRNIVSALPKDSKLKDIIATMKTQAGVIEIFTPITSDTDTIGKVTLGLSEHKINQQVVKTIMLIVVLNLVIMFIVGAGLFIASKKLILDPIAELVHATIRFAKGDLTTRVEIKTTGEMLVLVESFNQMMEDLGKAIVSNENELAERKRAEEKIRQMAYHDSLTGLPNRKLFSDRLGIALAQAQRNQKGVAVSMLDLDKFKNVNDTLGHDVGDVLLKAAAERLSAALRKGDTVARFGGDEFVLIFPDLKGTEDVIRVAQKIIDSFRKPFLIDTHQLVVTASIGIAVYSDDGIDEGVLLKNADIAMYQAKQT